MIRRVRCVSQELDGDSGCLSYLPFYCFSWLLGNSAQPSVLFSFGRVESGSSPAATCPELQGFFLLITGL